MHSFTTNASNATAHFSSVTICLWWASDRQQKAKIPVSLRLFGTFQWHFSRLNVPDVFLLFFYLFISSLNCFGRGHLSRRKLYLAWIIHLSYVCLWDVRSTCSYVIPIELNLRDLVTQALRVRSFSSQKIFWRMYYLAVI